MIVKIVYTPKSKSAIPFTDRIEADDVREIPLSKKELKDGPGYFLRLLKENQVIKTVRIHSQNTTVYFMEDGKTTDTIRSLNNS